MQQQVSCLLVVGEGQRGDDWTGFLCGGNQDLKLHGKPQFFQNLKFKSSAYLPSFLSEASSLVDAVSDCCCAALATDESNGTGTRIVSLIPRA